MVEYLDAIPPELALAVTPISARQLPGKESGMDVRGIYLAEKHRLRTGETISVDEYKKRYGDI